MKRLLFAALCFTACTADIDSLVTISQGLYGQIREACTGDGCDGAPRANAPVAWFLTNPLAHDGGVQEPAAQTRTSAAGFFELTLDAGTQGYLTLGTDAKSPTLYFTATQERVPRGVGRIDWQSGGAEEGTWLHVK